MLHLVAGILFFLLSPGVLLTIPAGSRGLLASGQTSVLAAAVHAVVFVAAIYFLSVSVEGFFGSQAECTDCSMKCGARRNQRENCNVTCVKECTETAPARAPARAPAPAPAPAPASWGVGVGPITLKPGQTLEQACKPWNSRGAFSISWQSFTPKPSNCR
jgi:hypothetical protein